MLIPTLSAPFNRIFLASSSEFTPPPTVNGMSMTAAICLTKPLIVSLFYSEAVISKKTSSSAPSSLYFAASSSGSPASFIDSKCKPLTTRPPFTSKHGITRLVNVKTTPLPPQQSPYPRIAPCQELYQKHFFGRLPLHHQSQKHHPPLTIMLAFGKTHV